MNKKIVLILLVTIFMSVSATYIYAQSTTVFKSNSVITKVGNAPESEKPKEPTTPGGGNIASCPIAGGKITTPSYQADPQRGHCGGGYAFDCACGTTGRRAKAIDVASTGQPVQLPKVSGQDVSWKLITNAYPINGGEGGGFGYTFQATVGGDTWYLDMLHLASANLESGKEYPSGTAVAAPVIDHLHMTIGKNLKGPVSAGSSSDCDPGWLPSDFVCQ